MQGSTATRQRPLTSKVRHIHQLTAIIFCRLAPSVSHHSTNAGNCSRTAEASCSVAACSCTGCHSVHGEARITQKGSLCGGQHACARTSRRICTPTSTLSKSLPSLRLHPDAGWVKTIVLPELTHLGVKKGLKISFVMKLWIVPRKPMNSTNGNWAVFVCGHSSLCVRVGRYMERSEPEDRGAHGVAMEDRGQNEEGESHGAARTLQASPHKGGSRSNPSERMLIASYIPMTQPSEPPRSPFKVQTTSSCSTCAVLLSGPAAWRASVMGQVSGLAQAGRPTAADPHPWLRFVAVRMGGACRGPAVPGWLSARGVGGGEQFTRRCANAAARICAVPAQCQQSNLQQPPFHCLWRAGRVGSGERRVGVAPRCAIAAKSGGRAPPWLHGWPCAVSSHSQKARRAPAPISDCNPCICALALALVLEARLHSLARPSFLFVLASLPLASPFTQLPALLVPEPTQSAARNLSRQPRERASANLQTSWWLTWQCHGLRSQPARRRSKRRKPQTVFVPSRAPSRTRVRAYARVCMVKWTCFALCLNTKP
jgi:hypothetical protein